MKRRAATKTFTLSAIAALIGAPLVVATATPASAATSLTSCTEAALQAALDAGGSYDLSVCAGQTLTVTKQAGLIENQSKSVTLSYTGSSSQIPKLKFSNFGNKGSLLDVENGDVNLVGLSLTGVTLSIDATSPTQGGAIYVANGASLTLNKDILTGSTAFGGGSVNGTAGTTGTPNGTSAANDAAAAQGGAVYNAGTLNVIGSIFSANLAAGGKGGNGGAGLAGTTGTAGTNAATAASPGTAGGAGTDGGNGGNGTNGADGQGGAIYNASTGSLSINSALFAQNAAVGGNGGSGGNAANGGNGGAGGAGATATTAGGAGSAGGNGGNGGNGGTAGTAGTAGDGLGGAIYNAGTEAISSVSFSANAAAGGTGGNGGNGSDPGNGGQGGAGGSGVAATTSGNGGAGANGGNVGAVGASAGNGKPGTDGGDAAGGAIWDNGASSAIASSTFASDTVTGGNGGNGGGAGSPNSATASSGGKGGNGGGASSALLAAGGAGGNGGNGANGSPAFTAGAGGSGGDADGLSIFTTSNAKVGCLTLDTPSSSNMVGGTKGSGGAAGAGAPKANGGAGGSGGPAGSGIGSSPGANGTAGTNGSSGGDAAAAGANGTAGTSDGTAVDGGPGDQACATISPAAISASANVGQEVDKTVTITNTGDIPFSVSGVDFTGDTAGEIATPTNGCTSPLAHGDSCQITLKITPSAAGQTENAALVINDNGVGGSQTVPVTITGNADISHLSIKALASKITAGHGTIVSTTLADLTTLQTLPGQTVKLYGKAANASSYTFLGAATTGGSGQASLPVTPRHKTTYQWRFTGKGAHAATNSGTVTINVVRTVSIALQHSSIRAGGLAVIYGTTNPADSGVTVTLFQKNSHGKWVKAGATTKTRRQNLPNGVREVGYVLKARATARGTYILRVACAATRTNLGSNSATKSLLVS